MNGRFITSVALATLVGGLSACHHQKLDSPTSQPSANAGLKVPIPEVLSFSETQSFTALAAQVDMLYIGTSTGVIRFDQRDGSFTRYTTAQGLAGNKVFALASHVSSGLWVVTDGGVSRFQNNVWTNTSIKGLNPAQTVTMVAMEDGFWSGGAAGLGRYRDGKWKRFLPGARVTHLLEDPQGRGFWIGTDGEGIYHCLAEKIESHSITRGQRIRKVSGFTFTATGGLFAVGEGDEGDLLMFYDGTQWISVTLNPPTPLDWVKQVKNQTLLSADGQIFNILRREPAATDKLPEGPVQLISAVSDKAPEGYPAPQFYTRELDLSFPSPITAMVETRQQVLMGTPWQGALLFDGQQTRWFRTNDLTGPGERLRMACTGGVCYLVGGGGASFKFQGGVFTKFNIVEDQAATAQAFVADAGGAIFSIHRRGDGKTLVVSKLSDQGFTKLYEAQISIPQGQVEVSFARFDGAGRIWAGLAYIDSEGDRRPWGITVLSQGAPPVYHRDSLLPTEDRQEGSLALPDDIRNVAFIDQDIWLATGAGACRVRGTNVDLFTENEELASEFIYDIAKAKSGEILAATYAGVGRYDGKHWRFDLPGIKDKTSRALIVDQDVLWVGTSAGLIRHAGDQVQRISMKHGLAGEVIYDLYLERSNRVWVLTDKGLSIVSLNR